MRDWFKRLLCAKGLRHEWEEESPKGDCCFSGVNFPVTLHKLDGTREDMTKHKCIVTHRRKCTCCGVTGERTLDTMGHPHKDEYYWMGMGPRLPKAHMIASGHGTIP